MVGMIEVGLSLLCLLFQAPQGTGQTPPAGPAPGTPTKAASPAPAPDPFRGVTFGKDGWPEVTEVPVRPVATPLAAPPTTAAPAVETAPAAAVGSGLGSPLVDVFQTTRSPAAFQALGGVTAWWRLTVHGAGGETVGIREITHRADLGALDRDRLELTDGRVYARAGAMVFVERQGMPWPTLAEAAGHELHLFGVLLRAPWVFADTNAYTVLGRDFVQRGGARLARIRIQRRPDTPSELIGPDPEPRPRDQFELLCEPSSMQPRELLYQLACSGQSRRILLEDWRETGGVRIPHRRLLVDGQGRPTTTLEILRLEVGQPLSDRDFRLR